ncbi:MAG: hypothetical protein WCT31_01285 [Candidatus Micrarchaeia archaeon]
MNAIEQQLIGGSYEHYEQPVRSEKQKQSDLRKDLQSEKEDDGKMPVFSKEFPIQAKKKEEPDGISIEYHWKPQDGPAEIDYMKVHQIKFRQGENLEYLPKINARDGLDSISISHLGITYFLRKTSEEVAIALYNAAMKITGSIESIVGYLRTTLGNFYIISSIERGSWVFDKKLKGEQVNLADVSKLDGNHRERLTEMAVEKLANLHKQRLVLGKFGLENILITTKELLFTDLRKMRVSRKSSLFVNEFLGALRYLMAKGIARKCDAIHATMAYSVGMKDACDSWYLERNGKRAVDEMELFERMEKEL